jgi:hypothetical protein
VGCAAGWLSKDALLASLIEPWIAYGTILEDYPTRGDVLGWHLRLTWLLGIVAALPFVVLLCWEQLHRRSCPRSAPSRVAFALGSYSALALGLVSTTLVLLPQLAVGARTSREIRPVPWAFVEADMYVLLAVACLMQAAVLLFAWLTSLRARDDATR